MCRHFACQNMIYSCATSTLLQVLINAFVMHDIIAFKKLS